MPDPGVVAPRVLVIEPDVATAERIRAELAGVADVLLAADVAGALALCERHADSVAVVVSDVALPGQAGRRERPHVVWAQVPRAARVLLTGAEDPDGNDRQTITAVSAIAGAGAVVSRPFAPGTLARAVAGAAAARPPGTAS